ncbi:hypothetical protein ABW20_dc0104770 [Dactylellina cionopaga]|nr:hypothetical protein ABW20_dc0104770 [Dactylellina cionopaga]
MSKPHPPLSTVLPPLLLGSATFNSQYNKNPFSLPTNPIINRFLTSSPHPGFDTSPYYGPAEILLGHSLKSTSSSSPQDATRKPFLATKIGRIGAAQFDYSPTWINYSIARSLTRLNASAIDLVYCHDVEFVSPAEVLSAVITLRQIRDSKGTIKYIGISGYPVSVLADLAEMVKTATGEPLDAVMSYGNYTVQNTRLHSVALKRLREDAGVECVLNASLLGMGLLRTQGVPVGDMGDFHPSEDGLRRVCRDAVKFLAGKGKKLEEVAYRWALDNWADAGAGVGTSTAASTSAVGSGKNGEATAKKMGVSVIGVSYVDELESILEIWKDVVAAREGNEEARKRRRQNDLLVEDLKGVFGKWYDDVWESPGEGYVRKEPASNKFLSDEELWPELKALKR